MEEMQNLPYPVPFTGYMTRREMICALLWLPVHVLGLPLFSGWLMEKGTLTAAQGNLLVYGVSALFIVLLEFSYLRREFDPLCDHFAYCILQIISSYLLMMAMNLLVSGFISAVEKVIGNSGMLENQNNNALVELANTEMNVISAMSVFLAPIVEEVIFRGGIFCCLRKKNRTAAYAVSILLFSAYHIWSYAAADPTYWLYLLQYVPAGYLLCRCYERTNSVWCAVFFHMLTNAVALRALTAMESLL